MDGRSAKFHLRPALAEFADAPLLDRGNAAVFVGQTQPALSVLQKDAVRRRESLLSVQIHGGSRQRGTRESVPALARPRKTSA